MWILESDAFPTQIPVSVKVSKMMFLHLQNADDNGSFLSSVLTGQLFIDVAESLG